MVLKPGDSDCEILHEIELDGNAIGSAAICNGKVYVHTTEKLYRFNIETDSITWNDAPANDWPKGGEAAKLMAVPSDVLLRAGESAAIALKSVDKNGLPVAAVDSAEWEKFIPPTARVQAEMDASIEGGKISAAADAELSAGAWRANADGLEGLLRGRVI